MIPVTGLLVIVDDPIKGRLSPERERALRRRLIDFQRARRAAWSEISGQR